MIDLSTFKFRIWDKTIKTMLYLDGDYSKIKSSNEINDKVYKLLIPICNSELMMYSTRRDNNGKLLCMGDIIQYESDDIQNGVANLYIDRQNDDFVMQFLCNFVNRHHAPFSKLSDAHTLFDKIFIIGNVFENPELFK